MMVKRQLPTVLAIAFAVAALGGCSALNPINWYRDLSGASKNDALGSDQRNQKNLEAGSAQPYPNLGEVPDAPDRATGALDRDALQKSLVADRANARYTDEQLRAGTQSTVLVALPPPASPASATPAAPKTGSPPAAQRPASPPPAPAAQQASPPPELPSESPLESPKLASLPQGDAPISPPPAPAPPSRRSASAESSSAAAVSAGSGKLRPAPASSVQVASIPFADGSVDLSDAGRNRLSEIAAMQHAQGGQLRIVGHAPPRKDNAAAEQELANFGLALKRAKAVAQVLSSDGVAPQALAVEAAPTRGDAAGPANAEIFLEH